MSRTRADVAAGIAGALLALVAALAFAAPAAAHSQVVSTNPADGATITSLPAEISVTANEDLADLTGTGQGFALYLVGADGTKYQTTPISIDGPTVSAPAPAVLPAGAYELRYQIVSADTHPVSGSIHFSYAPSGTPAPGDAHPTAQPTGGTIPGGSGASPSDEASERPVPSEGVTLAAWLIPLLIVVVVGVIVWVVLAARRRD